MSLGMSARGSTHRLCCLDRDRLLPNQIPTYIAVKIKELFIGEKSQKRNKKEFVGRGCWAVASSGGLVPRGQGQGVVLPRGPPWLSTPLLATVAGYTLNRV